MNAVNYIVKCPSCGTGKRIPADKEGLKGHCGNCKATLPPMYCHPQQMTGRTGGGGSNKYAGKSSIGFLLRSKGHTCYLASEGGGSRG